MSYVIEHREHGTAPWRRLDSAETRERAVDILTELDRTARPGSSCRINHHGDIIATLHAREPVDELAPLPWKDTRDEHDPTL